MIDTTVKKNCNTEWITNAYIDKFEQFECDEQDLVDKLDFYYPISNSVSLKPLSLEDEIPDNSETNTNLRQRLQMAAVSALEQNLSKFSDLLHAKYQKKQDEK